MLVKARQAWGRDLLGNTRAQAEARGYTFDETGVPGALVGDYGGPTAEEIAAKAAADSPVAASVARAEATARVRGVKGPVVLPDVLAETQSRADAAKAALAQYNWDRDLKQMNGYALGDLRNIDKALETLGPAGAAWHDAPDRGAAERGRGGGDRAEAGFDSTQALGEIRAYIAAEGIPIPESVPGCGAKGRVSLPSDQLKYTTNTTGEVAQAYEDLAARAAKSGDRRPGGFPRRRAGASGHGAALCPGAVRADFPAPPPGVQQAWEAIQRQLDNGGGAAQRDNNITPQPSRAASRPSAQPPRPRRPRPPSKRPAPRRRRGPPPPVRWCRA